MRQGPARAASNEAISIWRYRQEGEKLNIQIDSTAIVLTLKEAACVVITSIHVDGGSFKERSPR